MERIWYKKYPQGMPQELNTDQYKGLWEVFSQSCQKFPDRPAFSSMGVEMTYGELEAKAKAFSAYLMTHTQLKPGDRVAIQLPNCLQYPIALFGVLGAGLVVVNTNPLYTPREMKHQFNDSGVKGLIILENFAHNLEKIQKETAIETVVLTELGDMFPVPKRWLVNAVLRHVKKMVPAHHVSGIRFREVLAKGDPSKWSAPKVDGEDVALLQYTGGTTGVAKGAMITHNNLIANMEQMVAWIGASLEPGKEVSLTALPMYHIFCFTVNCLGLTKLGAHNVLVANPRDLPALLKEFKRVRPSIFTVVNTLANAMMEQPAFKELDFSSLKVMVAGGMALQPATAARWEKLTGIKIVEGYGLTESSPVVTCNPLSGEPRSGSIGLPLPSTDVAVFEEGKPVPTGEVGELVVKGPQVMKGYWERPEETAESIRDGWLYTGDMAKMDEDGFFRIVDRKKEMILVSGFNVYPNEVEGVVMSHPKVLEAAAIGIPDPHSGEVVKVYAVLREEGVTEQEIRTWCKEQLTAYKVPKQVEFRKELPKTNVGKVLRRALKEEYDLAHPAS